MKYLLIALITITLFGCGGAEERKAMYLGKAKLSLEAGDLEKARIELKNVLQIDPKDAQAYFMLGDVLNSMKEFRKAYANYSKASELDPDNLEYHARIGDYILVLSGDIDAAIEKRDLILGKDGTNVSGLLLKAGILFKQNDATGAKKIAREIFSKQPGHVRNALFLSSLYLSNKEYEDSINILNSCINENPMDRALVNALADVYYKAGKYSLAENEYKAVLENDPEVFTNYLKLAVFYRKIDENDKAEKILRKANEADDEDFKRKLTLVEFIQQTRGNQGAIDELKNLIVNYPDVGDFRLALAKLHISENNQNEAEKVLDSTVSDFSEDSIGIKARVYLASLYLQKKNVDAAISIIDEAFKISSNDTEVNFVKAKLQLINKDYEGAIISLRIVIKDDPENIDAYFLLSSAYKGIGDEAQAGEIIDKAYDNNRTNANSLMVLARHHDKSKNSAKLEKVINNYLSIDSNNYEALSYKAKLLNDRKMHSDAKPYALQMIELYPDMSNGYIQSLPYLLAENKQMEAIGLLEDGYKKVAENLHILEIIVSIYESINDLNAATNRVKLAISNNGETAELFMLMAKIQLLSNKSKDAKISLSKAIDINPILSRPYFMLASIYIADNQNQKAINVLQQGLAKSEGELILFFQLTKIYEDLGDFNASINEYEKAYEKHPDNVILINNLAVLLSQHRNDENSLKRAKGLADKLKNSKQAVILDTVGWVYYQTGYHDDAVNVLKTVVEISPEVGVFNYHLGMALYKVGDEVSAKTYLTRSLANNNNFPGKEDAETLLRKLQ